METVQDGEAAHHLACHCSVHTHRRIITGIPYLRSTHHHHPCPTQLQHSIRNGRRSAQDLISQRKPAAAHSRQREGFPLPVHLVNLHWQVETDRLRRPAHTEGHFHRSGRQVISTTWLTRSQRHIPVASQHKAVARHRRRTADHRILNLKPAVHSGSESDSPSRELRARIGKADRLCRTGRISVGTVILHKDLGDSSGHCRVANHENIAGGIHRNRPRLAVSIRTLIGL